MCVQIVDGCVYILDPNFAMMLKEKSLKLDLNVLAFLLLSTNRNTKLTLSRAKFFKNGIFVPFFVKNY